MEKRKVRKFKSLNSDFMLKIYSCVLAVIIWFILAITMYPTIDNTVTDIPVVINLAGSFAETEGLSPIDFDGIEVTARLRGMRYEIGNINKNGLTASADLSSVRSDGVYDLAIEVTANDGTELEVLSISPESVKVRFDYIKSKTFTIEPEAPYLSASSGYIIDKITSNPETVTITAPLEDINRITRVVLRTNSTNSLTQSTSIANTELILYDGTTVLDNSNYEFNRTSFNIEASVYSEKTIPLTFSFVDVPTNFDISILEYKLSNETITISSPTSLSNVESWNLGYLSLKDITPGKVFEFDVNLLSEYRNISNIEKVSITFDNEEWTTKTIALSYSQLFVINGSSSLDIEIQSAGISNITVIAPADIIDSISASDFVGEVDLNGVPVPPGLSTKSMTVYAPNYPNVWCTGNYSAAIMATQIESSGDD